MLRAMRVVWLALSLVTLTTGCYSYRRAGLGNAIITQDPDAVAAREPPAPPPSRVIEGLVVSTEEARSQDLVEERVVVPFGPNQDGTQLVADLLGTARKRKAGLTDVNLVFEASPGIECRVGIQPEGVEDPIAVPAGSKMVKAPAPRKVSVTENERVCQGSEYRCNRMDVRIPYQRSYGCEVVPAARPATWQPEQSNCRTEQVTHTVSRYDFELAARFVPIHFEELQKGALVETAPVCYSKTNEAQGPATGNRLEATLHEKR